MYYLGVVNIKPYDLGVVSILRFQLSYILLHLQKLPAATALCCPTSPSGKQQVHYGFVECGLGPSQECSVSGQRKTECVTWLSQSEHGYGAGFDVVVDAYSSTHTPTHPPPPHTHTRKHAAWLVSGRIRTSDPYGRVGSTVWSLKCMLDLMGIKRSVGERDWGRGRVLDSHHTCSHRPNHFPHTHTHTQKSHTQPHTQSHNLTNVNTHTYMLGGMYHV